MLRPVVFVFLYFYGILSMNAQHYDTQNIDPALTENADAVVRFDDYDIRLFSRERMLIKRKFAVTILNENAADRALLMLFYNPSRQIKKVYGEIRDRYGRLLHKIHRGDFKDYSATDAHTLYSDERVLSYRYLPLSYPFTIYFEYEILTSNTAFIPLWFPVDGFRLAVENSSYRLRFPSGLGMHRSERNFDGFPVQKKLLPGNWFYRISRVPAMDRESLAPSPYRIFPYMKAAATRFRLAGLDGTAENWPDLGRWIYNHLLAPRNNLPPETVREIRQMTRDLPPRQRAEKVYAYMQNKTRYVNIAIGIGGWQPMYTADVDRLGYGDCKALTFYTLSLLEAAGVPSYYTIVYAGRNKRNIDRRVPAIQGNHAILCVPFENDTVWLECTNPDLPFGHTGDFTDDRDVFVIKPTGGAIVHTPGNPPEKNLYTGRGEFRLSGGGRLSGHADMEAYGTQYDRFLHLFGRNKPEALKQTAREMWNYLHDIRFDTLMAENDKKNDVFRLHTVFSAENYSIAAGKNTRLIHPNPLNRNTYVPPKNPDRRFPVVIRRGYKDSDTYLIHIPEGYTYGALPEPVRIRNAFGTYEMHIVPEGPNTLKYTRIFILHAGTYPAGQYDAYRRFRKKIKKYENTHIPIIKN